MLSSPRSLIQELHPRPIQGCLHKQIGQTPRSIEEALHSHGQEQHLVLNQELHCRVARAKRHQRKQHQRKQNQKNNRIRTKQKSDILMLKHHQPIVSQ